MLNSSPKTVPCGLLHQPEAAQKRADEYLWIEVTPPVLALSRLVGRIRGSLRFSHEVWYPPKSLAVLTAWDTLIVLWKKK